jgi:FMN-dependent NADH-azoreductase
MKLFRLDASIKIDGSISREVADTAEKAWRAVHPEGEIIRRDVGQQPLSLSAWPAAHAAKSLPPADRTPEQAEATALAATLADELLAADAYLFAVPLYNFGVPAHVKNWIDLVAADPRFPSGAKTLDGRPAVLVMVRGGGYGPGSPREGWDHATAYLRRILADVWGLDLHVTEAELTLAGVNPAMASLIDLAVESRRQAHITAAAQGDRIASLIST